MGNDKIQEIKKEAERIAGQLKLSDPGLEFSRFCVALNSEMLESYQYDEEATYLLNLYDLQGLYVDYYCD